MRITGYGIMDNSISSTKLSDAIMKEFRGKIVAADTNELQKSLEMSKEKYRKARTA